MQKTQFKTTTSFLSALVTGAKIAKTKTSFLEVQCSYLYNSFFYCSYSIKLNLGYVPLCPNNFGFDYCFFVYWP